MGGSQCLPAPASLQSEISTQIYVHRLMSQSNPVRHLQQKLDFLGKKLSRKAVLEDIESAVVEFGTLGEDDHQEDLQVEADASTGNATLSFSEGFSGENQTSRCIIEQQHQQSEDEPSSVGFEESQRATEFAVNALIKEAQQGLEKYSSMNEEVKPATPVHGDDVCLGSDIELVFDPPFDSDDEAKRPDPFAECFEEEETVVERYIMEGPDDFQRRLHIASREGQSINRKISELTRVDRWKKQNNVVAKKEEPTSSVALQSPKHVRSSIYNPN